mgnify:CR=1 FL=1
MSRQAWTIIIRYLAFIAICSVIAAVAVFTQTPIGR